MGKIEEERAQHVEQHGDAERVDDLHAGVPVYQLRRPRVVVGPSASMGPVGRLGLAGLLRVGMRGRGPSSKAGRGGCGGLRLQDGLGRQYLVTSSTLHVREGAYRPPA